jgi:hypothetical protein
MGQSFLLLRHVMHPLRHATHSNNIHISLFIHLSSYKLFFHKLPYTSINSYFEFVVHALRKELLGQSMLDMACLALQEIKKWDLSDKNITDNYGCCFL